MITIQIDEEQMKTYNKYFMQKLAKNLNIPEQEFNQKLNETEHQITESMPEYFNFDELISITCDEFKITIDEFRSGYRYGNLGKARQVVCYIMKLLEVRNKRISKVSGFKSSNISASVRIISRDQEALVHVNNILQNLKMYEEV